MGKHRRRNLLAIGIACCSAWAWPQLTTDERAGLNDALFVANWTEKDLEFERKAVPATELSPVVTMGIDRPLAAADALFAKHLRARTLSVSGLIADASSSIYGVPTTRSAAQAVVEPPTGLPPELGRAVADLSNWIIWANSEIRTALEPLSPEDRRKLIEGLPVLAAEEDKVKFDFVRSPALSRGELFELANKVQVPRILDAGAALAAAVERTMTSLRTSKEDVSEPVRLKLGGLQVLVYGRGDDLHDRRDGSLEIDLGGNDRYTGRHGAGIGYAAVCIDLGGDDTFALPDASGGTGLLGIGLLRVVGGQDVFRGGSMTFGAGILGVGSMAREGGNDLYESAALSQGFGMYGIGLVVDTFGRDTYNVQLFGQGSSRTKGVGWLIDRAGSDVYKSGGLSLNSPLFKDVYYSFSQGFSSGYREDTGGSAGGLGLLTDLAGDDYYLAETYAQAASYWYAVGSLLDASGHDTYSGYHYVQASAMHLCASYLFDLAGDDGYLTKFGASHAIGHDYAVAFLLDRAGNDVYAARDSSPGTGNANGVGLFLDGAGDDRYQGPPGKGNPARGTGSIGVFADLSGQDLYREGPMDGGAMETPTWGVSIDRETPRQASATTNNTNPTGRPGSLAKPSDADLEVLYKRATQWAVGTAQQDTADAVQRLVLIGLPAFEWMIDSHLKAASRLEIRAFDQMIGAIGEPARQTLAGRMLTSKDNAFLANALSLCVDAKVVEAAPLLSGFLKNPVLQKQAVRAAGSIGNAEVVPDLLPICAGLDKTLATYAMVSLAQIGSEEAYPTAEALIASPVLPMRMAAMALVSKFPLRGLETAKRLMLDSDERTARIGVQLLAAIGSEDALKEAGSRLMDPSAGIRIQALTALNGRCQAEFRSAFMNLREDPIPLVRSVARRADPGR